MLKIISKNLTLEEVAHKSVNISSNEKFNFMYMKGALSMKKLNFLVFCGFFMFFSIISTPVFSQPSASQTVGGIVQQEAFPQKAMTLSERLKQEKVFEAF